MKDCKATHGRKNKAVGIVGGSQIVVEIGEELCLQDLISMLIELVGSYRLNKLHCLLIKAVTSIILL